MTTPGYFVQELSTGKLLHTGDIIQVEDMPEGVELPDREAGVIHEVDDREDVPQPRKRPGRTRGSIKLLQRQTETEVVDWGELQNRGAQMLSRELQLLEEDSGEIRNERFLKALTTEIEEIGQEAVRVNQQEKENLIAEIEEKTEEAAEFLQTRMVGLSEVRKNLEEWKPSMCEEYGALVVESEAVEPISRQKMIEMKEEAARSGKTFDLLPAKAIFSRKAGSGRHKCRGVACGNHMKLRSDESTFASGAGGPEVRLLLKIAATRGWSASTVDVKTAFLNAPVDNSADRRTPSCFPRCTSSPASRRVVVGPKGTLRANHVPKGLVPSQRQVHPGVQVEWGRWHLQDREDSPGRRVGDLQLSRGRERLEVSWLVCDLRRRHHHHGDEGGD